MLYFSSPPVCFLLLLLLLLFLLFLLLLLLLGVAVVLVLVLVVVVVVVVVFAVFFFCRTGCHNDKPRNFDDSFGSYVWTTHIDTFEGPANWA